MTVLDFAAARAAKKEPAWKLRRRLMYPHNAVIDSGINMRNGHPVPSQPQIFVPSAPIMLRPDPPPDFTLLRQHKMLNIIKLVSAEYNVPAASVMGHRRLVILARPRQVAMWLCRRITAHTYKEIARRFGNRDHTTVVHSVANIEARRATDPELAAKLDQFLAILDPIKVAS